MIIRKLISCAIILYLLVLSPSFGQLSPGDLAQVHAHLEGTANCTKCHVLGEKVSNKKCLDCHKEIKSRVDIDKGYHSSPGVKGKDCFHCHNDHHGRNFQIIRFDPDTFDHVLSGYPLEGNHATLSCKDCHQPNHIADPDLKNKKTTYLGLSRSCLICHTNTHQGTLPETCLDCHDYDHFVPATKFDHSTTGYPLKGKHQEVDCRLCHWSEERNGVQLTIYNGIAYDNCTDCHSDVHDNKFGQDCAKCHTEISFHDLKNPELIDHERTNFPLLGKHRSVDCKDCHKNKFTDPIPHKNCMDCHDDYHEGQFLKAGGIADCSDCHDMAGFTPSTFTVAQHRESQFPLEGAHLATPCFLCHQKENSIKWQFREIGKNCIDCHEDIHQSYINDEYYPDGACTNCHQVSRWNEIRFDHLNTGYELIGKHKAQSCRACHYDQAEDGSTVQQFANLKRSCFVCHDDIHYSQFEEYGNEGCLLCHGFDNWKAEKFNHDQTNFKLDGKHTGLDCSQCHRIVSQGDVSYVLYKIKDYRCEDCH